MTSHRRPRHGFSEFRQPGALLPPGSLLTALPGMLGFIPERSFVLVAFEDDHTVAATMRHDLVFDDDGSPHPCMQVIFEQLGSVCARYGVAAIVMVIVDERDPDDDHRRRDMVACADAALAESGGVTDAFAVSEYAEGAPWRRIRHLRPSSLTRRSGIPVVEQGEASGVLGDPHSSPTAVAKAVRSGRLVLHRRSEMADMLVPSAHCDSAVCAGVHSGVPTFSVSTAALLRTLVAHVLGQNGEWDCRTVAVLESAILDLEVRDAAMGLSVGEYRADAERLWRELTRRLRGRGRASAATLLGHLHYVAGEGAYAGVALDCALQADPDWNLARLLDQALRNGMRPTEMVDIVDRSFDIAERLGVSLPGRTVDPAA